MVAVHANCKHNTQTCFIRCRDHTNRDNVVFDHVLLSLCMSTFLGSCNEAGGDCHKHCRRGIQRIWEHNNKEITLVISQNLKSGVRLARDLSESSLVASQGKEALCFQKGSRYL